MNQFEQMAELLLPHIDKEPEYYESLYPQRDLPEGARVVRIAPSPTGYLHLGTLFMALVNRITANSTGGVFYTRIEDTDKKREIEGGIDDIINGLLRFGINIDEGFVTPTKQEGKYAPYKQSLRGEIYQCFVKKLVKEGLAYPCFCTAEELEAVRNKQEAEKIRTGYHGEYAVHRNITVEEAKALIDEGKPYVIRLKSPGSEENRIFFEDGIKGKVEMPENDEDFVLLKSDGIPTYHFAHAVDDHLMRTTHVIRGDEWISSVPKHIQLFKILGFKPPKFCHVAPIMKLDNGAKRKISKRKDPEAAVYYFAEEGYEADSVIEYLMTVASSEFEDWRRANPNESYKKFKFNLKKMSVSGALFDNDKLKDVSKNIVSKMDSATVVQKLTDWAKEFDTEFYNVLTRDLDYTKAVFAIDRDCPKPRKDIAKWNEAKEYCAYFYNEYFQPCREYPEHIEKEDIKAFLNQYVTVYSESDTKEEWFGRIKSLCAPLGFAADTKEYKANKEAFKGSVGDLSTVLRVAITGRRNTPDLWSIMQVLGINECKKRILDALGEI